MAALLAIGLISGGAGIYLLYIFFTSIRNEANFVYLILSFVFFIVSVIFIIKITNPKKIDTSVVDQAKVYEKTLEKLEKNSAVVAEWSKTNEQRDKLELLKMAANIKESEDEIS